MHIDPFIKYCEDIAGSYEQFNVVVGGSGETYGAASFHVLAGRAQGYLGGISVPVLVLADAHEDSIATIHEALPPDVILPDGQWEVPGMGDRLYNFSMLAQHDLLDASGAIFIDPNQQPPRVGGAAVRPWVQVGR